MKLFGRDIGWLFSSEVRLCSLLIGIIEIIWSLLGIIPNVNHSLFATRLYEVGLDSRWFMIIGLTGLVLAIGSIFPWRAGRHIGLFLSALAWAVMSLVFIDLIAVSPVASSMPVFCIFCVGLIYADSKRKYREKLDT